MYYITNNTLMPQRNHLAPTKCLSRRNDFFNFHTYGAFLIFIKIPTETLEWLLVWSFHSFRLNKYVFQKALGGGP